MIQRDLAAHADAENLAGRQRRRRRNRRGACGTQARDELGQQFQEALRIEAAGTRRLGQDQPAQLVQALAGPTPAQRGEAVAQGDVVGLQWCPGLAAAVQPESPQEALRGDDCVFGLRSETVARRLAAARQQLDDRILAGHGLAERPDGNGHMFTIPTKPAVAARMGQIAAREEAHRAQRQMRRRRRHRRLPGGEPHHRPGGRETSRLFQHSRRQCSRERRIVEIARMPDRFRRGLCGGRRYAGRLHLHPLLIGQHQGHAMPAQTGRRTAADRFAQRAARSEAGLLAVLVARLHGRIGQHVDLRQAAFGDVLLRALDEAGIGQRGQRLDAQFEQIRAQAHQRTFSASHEASSPGVIAPTSAPTLTSRAAVSRS